MWFKKYKIDLDGLAKVEKVLDVKLPHFLWDFYQNEARLIGKLRRVSRDTDYIHFTTDFEWMLSHNRDFLKLPKKEGICRNKICIGTDGCGNDSLVTLSNDDQRVFFIDHEIAGELIDPETDDFKWEDDELEKYDSLKAYVKDMIQLYRGF